MVSVVQNIETDAHLWISVIEAKYAGKGEKWTRQDWDKLLGDSQACVDMPSILFTLELVEAYPEAKVILLNRDAEEWYESVLGSVGKAMKPSSTLSMFQNSCCMALDPDHRAWFRFGRILATYGMPYDLETEKDKAITWFKNSYQEVRDAIPPERRIEFSVKDGFKPLCEFLSVPIPWSRMKKRATWSRRHFRTSMTAQHSSQVWIDLEPTRCARHIGRFWRTSAKP